VLCVQRSGEFFPRGIFLFANDFVLAYRAGRIPFGVLCLPPRFTRLLEFSSPGDGLAFLLWVFGARSVPSPGPYFSLTRILRFVFAWIVAGTYPVVFLSYRIKSLRFHYSNRF
jgi:hypothetical protein